MTKTAEPHRWRRALIGLILVVLVLGVLRVWRSPEIPVPTNTPIRFDDFTFAVVGAREASLGSGAETRRYQMVRLKVQNDAKRVTYQFHPRIAVMVDDDGRQYGVSALGQVALDRLRGAPDPLATPLPAGASGTTELAFDLPETARNPRLKISHGGPVLDVVDDLLGGRRRLLLK
ncbi:MAG: hypothetical protein JWN86_628 [Planctomycetota bacterium]|nr:hypothetical protein [Planctomycetota bacterium]